jgi:hypothetical protein
MRLRFPATDIKRWAEAYLVRERETVLLGLRAEVHRVGFVSKNQLHLLAQ